MQCNDLDLQMKNFWFTKEGTKIMKYIRITMENYSILFEETILNFDLSPYENDYMFEYDSIIN